MSTTNRLAQMKAEYDRPGLGGHLARIRADTVRRATRVRTPDAIVTAPPFEGSRDDYLLSPVKGSIVLFWGAPESDVIPQLEQAYAEGDTHTLRRLSDAAVHQMERQPVGSLEEGVEAVLTSPMYFDLVYGTKVLASSLVLPRDNEYGAIAFSYNGGPIDEAEFKLVQHCVGEAEVEYRTLLLKVNPDLTAIEREALHAVPVDQSSINIGDATLCPFVTCALVAIVIALVTRAGIYDEMRSQLDAVTLSDSQLERLGPLASARELVALRREIFEEHGL